jgi:hypothetical protein
VTVLSAEKILARMKAEREQMLAIARAQAEARAAALMREAEKNAAVAEVRMAVADRLRDEGDIATAARIYVKLAVSKKSSAHAEAARDRLSQLGDEAKAKLAELDGQLASIGQGDDGQQTSAERFAEIREVFDRYEEASRQYGGLPGREGVTVRGHVKRQGAKPEFRAALNEPGASALWQRGQELEADDAACCAFCLYEEALQLLPAPSAIKAQDRLAEMKKDPQAVEAARNCQEVQWCLKTFERAERLAKVRKDRARELFQEVLAKAPRDSRVYADTVAMLDQLRN